jgi:hypothetical protein
MVSRFCTRCGQLLPTNATTCPRCNAPVTPPAPAATAGAAPSSAPSAGTASATPEASSAPARRICANCRAAMRWIGHYSLRASGTAPSSAGVAGSADPAETLLPFSLYYCQSCGKFDFYYPGT